MKQKLNSTLNAHLIRGAVYLLLLVAVCALPFALAQRNVTNRSVTPMSDANAVLGNGNSPDEATAAADQTFPKVSSDASRAQPFHIPPNPRAPQVVLYDQYDNASSIATLSATFTDFPAFSSDLADDFLVPTGETWNVESVDADGVYFNGAGPANSFNVFFYADNAGLPGAQVYSALNQPFTVAGSTFTVTLPTVAVLSEGAYWVEVQANMTFDPNGEWGWTDRTVQSNQGAAWQNPGGGFGICPTWTLKTTCIPTAGGPDQVFRLNGTSGGGSPTPTPTASGTATPTPSPTATASATASVSPSPSATPTATASVTPSPTATPSATPSATATATPSATPTPTATPTGCVRGQGYWKNHPEAWPVTELQLGNTTYTQDQLLAILREPVRGNGLLILAKQLIAAKLNIANGANGSCVQQTIADADALIGDLVIPPIGDGYLRPRDAAPLAGILGDFNGGGMCAPVCDHSSPSPTPRGRPHPHERPRR